MSTVNISMLHLHLAGGTQKQTGIQVSHQFSVLIFYFFPMKFEKSESVKCEVTQPASNQSLDTTLHMLEDHHQYVHR